MKSFRAKTWHASADAIYHLACEQALCFARRLISRDYAPVATHDRLLSRYLNFLLMITRARFQILDSLFWKMLDFIATFFWGVSKEKIATKAAFFRYYVSCYGRSMWGYICTKKRKLFFFFPEPNHWCVKINKSNAEIKKNRERSVRKRKCGLICNINKVFT